MQTGKMSNKRKRLLTATLRAHCGRAGEGREKKRENPLKFFCFSGFRRSINLLGRLQIFGWFVGNGLTVPCGLTDSMIYREVARHSARFYTLRAASGADGSRPIPTLLPEKGIFRQTAGGIVAAPTDYPQNCHHDKTAGGACPVPTARCFFCPVGRGDLTPPKMVDKPNGMNANFRRVCRERS